MEPNANPNLVEIVVYVRVVVHVHVDVDIDVDAVSDVVVYPARAPKKLNCWPKNGQIWPIIWICDHLGPNIGIFWTIWSHVRPKNNANKVPRWFLR